MEIDLRKLLELRISPSEYVVLELLSNKDFKSLSDMAVNDLLDWNNNTTFLGILEHLEHNKWIKIEFNKDTELLDFDRISLRQKALDLFSSSTLESNSKFDKLWSMYPIKVPNGVGGYRTLRAAGNGDQYKKALSKWQSIVKKKPLLADIMIEALSRQLKETRGSLQYMQQFNVWLNQSTWEKYPKVENEDDNLELI